MLLPWVRFLLPGLTGYNRRLRARDEMRAIMLEEIERHEAELDMDNPRDYIDSFLVSK